MKVFYNQLQSETERCIIYQSDILYNLNGGYHFEKATNKKAIAYRFIVPVSCHVILFQPCLNHKRGIERNNQREIHSLYFNVPFGRLFCSCFYPACVIFIMGKLLQ